MPKTFIVLYVPKFLIATRVGLKRLNFQNCVRVPGRSSGRDVQLYMHSYWVELSGNEGKLGKTLNTES